MEFVGLAIGPATLALAGRLSRPGRRGDWRQGLVEVCAFGLALAVACGSGLGTTMAALAATGAALACLGREEPGTEMTRALSCAFAFSVVPALGLGLCLALGEWREAPGLARLLLIGAPILLGLGGAGPGLAASSGRAFVVLALIALGIGVAGHGLGLPAPVPGPLRGAALLSGIASGWLLAQTVFESRGEVVAETHRRQIARLNASLDARVAERTEALAEALLRARNEGPVPDAARAA